MELKPIGTEETSHEISTLCRSARRGRADVAALALSSLARPAAAASHPLDALDAAEIAAAVALLRDAGHAGDETMFHSISLLEPPKEAVYAWRAGQPIPRAAAVTLRDQGKTYEARIDLTARKVTSFEAVTGGQPMIALPEILGAQGIALADQRMQDGLRKRGVTDFSQLFCAPRTAGNFGHAHEREHRIVKVDCFDIRGVTTDVFATPIEGLFATVDLDSRSVLEVTDAGVVPIPPGEQDFDLATLGSGARRQAGGAVVAARIERLDRRLARSAGRTGRFTCAGTCAPGP